MKPWKNLFQPHILERGRTYFDEGRVSGVERSADGYTACVDGTEEYAVEIILERGSVEDMICDCPYAEDGNACKHMAAVLFAVEAGGPAREKAPDKKKRLTPARLVGKIPDDQLRPLLTELVSADQNLYRTLLLRYGETSLEECVKTLKKELASIGKRYADRHGYIDYYHAGGFTREFIALVRRQTEMLLARDAPLTAFQAGIDALREYAGYSLDDSNGEYGMVTEAMNDMCTQVLTVADKRLAEKIFDFLADCIQSGREHWFVQEFAEQTVFTRFTGKHYDEKKLALVDAQIAAFSAVNELIYPGEYVLERLLTRRYELMKRLSRPKAELDAFLVQNISCSAIRRLRVQQLLDDGNTDEAVHLLEEGKSANRSKRGVTADYSQWLINLYEQQGQRDKLLAELEYHIFTLSSDGMEMLGRLKKACTPEQWVEYRERYLASKQARHRLELMESEGLWERLMEEVSGFQTLFALDRYEPVLEKRFPNEMLEAYVRVLAKEAAPVTDRKRYRELAGYLKRLKRYPGGVERAAQLAKDWRIRYERRRAMMEELQRAGF